MPKVDLIYYTGMESGDPYYAAKLLAFTKNTRLNMNPDGLQSFMEKPESEIDGEMDYMSKTIKSALEFVDLTFLIQGVSRATAQQITRTRNASYQMQSQRVSDVSEASWDRKEGEIEVYGVTASFDDCFKGAVENYSSFVANGMSLEDARDLLPIGIHCNLVAKYNLRSAIDLIRARESARVQGPYREVALQMKKQIIAVWPWVHFFFRDENQLGYDMLNEVIDELKEQGAVYKGPAGKIAKAIDLIKGGK